jgi:hypothetical protein
MGERDFIPRPSAREMELMNELMGGKEPMVYDTGPTPSFLTGGYLA